MSSYNNNNQSKQESAPATELEIKEPKKNHVEDPLVRMAIELGIKQADEAEPETKLTLKFTEHQKDMLNQLMSALNLSGAYLVESAISYAAYYTEIQGLAVSELKEYPQNIGSLPLELTLAELTVNKLKALGMTEKPNECAVIGIQLLYQQLIANNLKPNHQENSSQIKI